MKFFAWLILVGCAAQSSHVRSPDGQPLSTSARLDADSTPPTVHCRTGEYVIVEPPRPYLVGTHLATTKIHIRDAYRLCARIAAFDE